MVTCALEADSLEVEMLAKLNHDPRTCMVRSVPFVPLLFARTQQVLRELPSGRTTHQHMVFRCHFSSRVQVVPYQTAFCCLHCLRELTLAPHTETTTTTATNLNVDRSSVHHDSSVVHRLLVARIHLHVDALRLWCSVAWVHIYSLWVCLVPWLWLD